MQLLYGLRLLQAEAHIGQELIALFHGLRDGLNSGVAGLIGSERRRVAPIHHAERSVAQGGLVRCVEEVFRLRKPPDPLAWPIPRQTPEVHDDDAVGRLRLPVGLRVERRRHV